MASYIIEGGHRLYGEVTIQGAKNEALQVIAATLLTSEEVILENVPDILDVNNLIKLVQLLGVEVTRLNHDSYRFRAQEIDLDFVDSPQFLHESKILRGSVLLVGPLVGRCRHAVFPKPGGDQIGRRRLDTHLIGIATLGAECEYDQERRAFRIEVPQLRGAYMHLEEASVTGTANVIMSAVLAEGKTTIYNAACEPYIQQLCRMLVSMGARISGIGSNLLTIEGVERLHGTTHRILPEQMFRKLGIEIIERGDDLIIPARESYEIETFMDGSILTIADAPWPGLTPDLLSVFLVVATQAKGTVLIHQKMFESRLFFVDKLIDMGAQIILCDPHRAVVVGKDHQTRLRPAVMASPDIRAGIALLIAAMSADGTSVVNNAEQIDRGYQHLHERLNALGAHIERRDE